MFEDQIKPPPPSVEDSSSPESPNAKAAEGLSVMQQNVKLPRVVITFCTQCRWMLRAAYVSCFVSVVSLCFGCLFVTENGERNLGREWRGEVEMRGLLLG